MGKQGILLIALVLTTAACDAAPEPTGDACLEAQAHVDACGMDIALPDTCEASEAQAILDADCEQLADAGKADGCNPFFWWTCVGGGNGSASDPEEVTVRVKECGDYFGGVDCSVEWGAGSCIAVVAEDREGNVVATELTSVHGSVRFDLEPGDYVVRVLDRNDRETAMIDGNPLGNNETEQPARFEVTVGGGGDNELEVWLKRGTGEAELQRCAGASAIVSGTCDGAAMDVDETEWSWFVTFDDAETGERIDISRAHVRWFEEIEAQRNVAWGNDLPPGRYELNVHRMDIPSWQRRPNSDDELFERYAEGIVMTETFEVTLADATTTLDLGTLELSCE